VHRQAVGVERDPGAEPGLRVLPGELRGDPERRAVLLPGQPRVPRRRRHEPLLRLQRPAPLELLLQQLRARRAVRSKYHTKPHPVFPVLSSPSSMCHLIECRSLVLQLMVRARTTEEPRESGRVVPIVEAAQTKTTDDDRCRLQTREMHRARLHLCADCWFF